MNPVQAKAIAYLLLKNIQAYESINGTIAMPENMTATVETGNES